MKRSEFISNIGLSTQALLAFYCLGASSCTTGPVEAQPNDLLPSSEGLTGNAEPGNGKVDFSLDLTLSPYTALRTPRGFVRVGGVLVAHTKAEKYVAVSKFCTHAAGVLAFQADSNDFWCPVHGSLFHLDGSVKQSPAAMPIRLYKAALNNDKTRLSVTE
jgi:cytochrome b6-f complex iron-sulfur subunit